MSFANHLRLQFEQYFKSIKENLKPALTVSIVSIPQCLSFAVASAANPLAGITTSIWASISAGIFGSSRYNIVGPTSSLTGILAAYAIIYGPDNLAGLAVVSGIMILIIHSLKLYRYLAYIPACARVGFILGVAAIIILNQINQALGLVNIPRQHHLIFNVAETFKNIHSTNFVELLIFIIFLSGAFIINKFYKKIPPLIILAPLGILLGYYFDINILGEAYKLDLTSILIRPFKFVLNKELFTAAISISLIASIETMVSAKIADGITKTKHVRKKEILALGISNIVSGLMGGFAATASFSRTAINIQAGSNGRASAIMSGIFTAIFSILLINLLFFVPLAMLSAFLIFTAIKMIETEHLNFMFQLNKRDILIATIVALVSVYEDPFIGIIIGTVISLIFFVDNLSKGYYELVINHPEKGKQEKVFGHNFKRALKKSKSIIYSIKGHLTYINSHSHIIGVENISEGYSHIILRLKEVYFIDIDGIYAIDSILEDLRTKGKEVYITGVNPLIEKFVDQSHEFKKLQEKGHVLEKTSMALKEMGYSV